MNINENILLLENTISNLAVKDFCKSNSIHNYTDLSNWMKKNIKYKFKDIPFKDFSEVLSTKSGHCHEQCLFEILVLRYLGYKVNAYFCAEANTAKDMWGSTHSFVVINENNSFIYFENSWGTVQGCTKHNTINDVFKFIHDNWDTKKEYNVLEFYKYIIPEKEKLDSYMSKYDSDKVIYSIKNE